MRIYLDNQSVYGAAVSSLDTYISASAGTHNATVQAWDVAGNVYRSSRSFTVGSGGSTSISVSPTSAALQVNGKQQFSSSTSATWKVNGTTGGNSTVGTISTSGMYTAPASVPSGGSVSVTAQSIADPTKSASSSVLIMAASSSVKVSVSPGTATVQGGKSQQFTASVSGTSNTSVKWSVNGVASGNSTYGSISSTGMYTAPACPTISNATVTARSAYDGTASSNAAVTVSGSASAGTGGNYYVATNGSDSNDGSACRPWRTIQHAANVVNPGSTVNVADGTYPETVAITRGGTASAPIVFKAESKYGAKIAPSSTSGNSNYTLYFSHANYVTLQGFEITGTSTTAAGVKFDSGNYNSVLDNNIHDIGVSTSTCTSGGAVLIADSYNTVRGNQIWNVGPPRSAGFRCNQQHGIYVTAGSYGVIQNNLIYNTWQGYSLHLNGSLLSNWTITGNTIFNAGDNAHNSGGPFIFWCESGGTCDYNKFNDNIFANTQGGYCFWEENAGGTLGPNNQYNNNVNYNCGGQNILVTGKPSNTVTSNPMFMNYTGDRYGDYHLQPGSPAIDRGSTAGAPTKDYDGVARPQGAGIDIGAFEYKP